MARTTCFDFSLCIDVWQFLQIWPGWRMFRCDMRRLQPRQGDMLLYIVRLINRPQAVLAKQFHEFVDAAFFIGCQVIMHMP